MGLQWDSNEVFFHGMMGCSVFNGDLILVFEFF